MNDSDNHSFPPPSCDQFLPSSTEILFSELMIQCCFPLLSSDSSSSSSASSSTTTLRSTNDESDSTIIIMDKFHEEFGSTSNTSSSPGQTRKVIQALLTAHLAPKDGKKSVEDFSRELSRSFLSRHSEVVSATVKNLKRHFVLHKSIADDDLLQATAPGKKEEQEQRSHFKWVSAELLPHICRLFEFCRKQFELRYPIRKPFLSLADEEDAATFQKIVVLPKQGAIVIH